MSVSNQSGVSSGFNFFNSILNTIFMDVTYIVAQYYNIIEVFREWNEIFSLKRKKMNFDNYWCPCFYAENAIII